MASFSFKIIPDAEDVEPFQVEAGMRDLRLWEKINKGRAIGMVSDQARISATLLFEIAHATCRRQGKIPSDVNGDRFADLYDIETVNEDQPEATGTLDVDVLVARLVTEHGWATTAAEQAATVLAEMLAAPDEGEEHDPLSIPPAASAGLS